MIAIMRPEEEVRLLHNFLLSCLTADKVDTIVEVGTFAGESAVVFAKYAKHLICVDPYIGGYDDKDEASNELMMREAKAQFQRVRACHPNISHLELTSEVAAAILMPNSIDMVYLDGSHKREDVERDIKAWLPRVKPGGLIAGHDYDAKWFRGGEVKETVDAVLGKPFLVIGSNWAVRKGVDRPLVV